MSVTFVGLLISVNILDLTSVSIFASFLDLAMVSTQYKFVWHGRTHQAQHAIYTLIRLWYLARTLRLDTSGDSILDLEKMSTQYKGAWHGRTHQAQHTIYTSVRLAYIARTLRLDTSGGNENL
jgi:hypothetical protein